MKSLLLFLFLTAVASAQHTISGTVVDSTTGSPINHAHVMIAPSTARDRETGQFTDANGRFRFEKLPPGKYMLVGGSRTIPDQMFGARKLGSGTGVLIITGPGQNTEGLRFALIPPAAISGKVIDELGEPVRGALIQLISSGVVRGRRQVRQSKYFWSNSVGEYRIPGLPEGEYYVTASGAPWYTDKVAQSAELSKRGYATAYYPNTKDPAGAGRLTIGAGEEASANFNLTTASSANVTINFAARDAQMLYLASERMNGLETFHRVVPVLGNSSRLTGVLPGRYTATLTTGQVPRIPTARLVFEVGTNDVEVTLEAFKPVPVDGSLDAGDAQADAVRSCVLQLLDPEKKIVFRRSLDLNGNFNVPAVPAGNYQVSLFACHGIRIRNLKAEGAKADATGIEIAGTAVRMKVFAERANGAVRGIVTRNGRPAMGVSVVLAPKDESKYPEHVYLWVTDSDGSYDFTNIVPGDHHLLALDSGEGVEFASAAVLRPYLKQAQTVEVVNGKPCETRIELPAVNRK